MKITLKMTDASDLNRDVLKVIICTVTVSLAAVAFFDQKWNKYRTMGPVVTEIFFGPKKKESKGTFQKLQEERIQSSRNNMSKRKNDKSIINDQSVTITYDRNNYCQLIWQLSVRLVCMKYRKYFFNCGSS